MNTITLPKQAEVLAVGRRVTGKHLVFLMVSGNKPGEMNKTEGNYAWHMIPAIDNVLSYGFEPVTFLIGASCAYTPDFLIEFLDHWEVHEVKGGFVREDSKVKFKVASHLYLGFKINSKPITKFEMWQWKNKEWRKLYEIGGERKELKEENVNR